MKEEECESVTEAKGQTVKKKVDVLEAMAKYNLKKQQERDNNMKGTRTSTSPQESPAKRKNELQTNPTKETSVGITEYVHQGPGFSAILKQRYSDFHVYEISMEGNTVHLTDQSVPEYQPEVVEVVEVDSNEKPLSILTDEEWLSITEMMESEEKKVVEIDVTDKSREDRLKIHNALRKKYDKIVSNSGPAVDGKTVMKIFKQDGTREARRGVKVKPAYLEFVMYKENLSTMEAVGAIARRLKIRPGSFATAGTKDKRAVTSQLVTVKHVDPQILSRSLSGNNKIAIGNYKYRDSALQLGHLKGNLFSIALRNVLGEESVIEEALQSLKAKGFINYYGAQRFGTRHVPTHHIGKQLLLGKWQEAIDLILEPPEQQYARDQDLTEARNEYKASKNAVKAASKLNRSLYTIEGQLLINLKKYGKDLVGALNTIPRNMRLTYIHAYQSFLWNTVTSRRLATYGLKPIVGDLVYAPGSEGEAIDLEMENDENIQEETEKDSEAGSNKRAQRNQRKVIAIDESNISQYTIDDILLPLPGYDITYPSNEVANWFTELLEVDGLSETDFRRSVKTYNLGGAYRLLIAKPSNVEWKFVRYDNPMLSLIPSDWDRLQSSQAPLAAVKDGAYLGLVVDFTLPPSAYATMALREITKMDMSAEFQTTLNDAGSSKQTTPGEPDSKRIKQEEDAH